MGKNIGKSRRDISRQEAALLVVINWVSRRTMGGLPAPTITKIGGKNATLLSNTYKNKMVSTSMVPIFESKGQQVYAVDGYMDNLHITCHGMPHGFNPGGENVGTGN